MRRVTRSSVPVPSALDGEHSAGRRELERVMEYVKEKGTTKGFAFNVYKDATVRDALYRLFHGKCAYCESRIAGTQPVDVEHWRPKGRIDLGDSGELPTGYYWLAAQWDNLLPSCIDCNRERYQVEATLIGVSRILGKGVKFPLADESVRATTPAMSVAAESPLLIDPCGADEPDVFLQFGEEAVLRARRGLPEPGRARALASIETYALNRTELVQDRKAVMLLMSQRLFTIRVLVAALDRKDLAEAHDLIEDLLSHELHTLAAFADPERPYTLLAKQFIAEYITSLAHA